MRSSATSVSVCLFMISTAASADVVGEVFGPMNYAPGADPQKVLVTPGAAHLLTLTGFDADGDPLTFEIVRQPDEGTLSGLDPSTGFVTYDAPVGYEGSDSFEFRVLDYSHPSPPETVDIVVSMAPPCDDGFDNDGDGRVDFPDDVGCRDAGWWTESPQCSDGTNNDPGQDPEPGLIDFDGGQSVFGPCSGRTCPPGVSDPDSNGIADPDPQCSTAWKNKERAGGCGLGFEVGIILLPLLLLQRRRRAAGSQ